MVHTGCNLERCMSDHSWQTCPMWCDCIGQKRQSIKPWRCTIMLYQYSKRHFLLCIFGSYLKLLWNSDWPTCYGNVTVLVDVAGALPSQLQGHWGEMASCCLHHQFTHCAVSCVEDVVKSLPQQLLGLRHSTCHHWVQILQRVYVVVNISSRFSVNVDNDQNCV